MPPWSLPSEWQQLQTCRELAAPALRCPWAQLGPLGSVRRGWQSSSTAPRSERLCPSPAAPRLLGALLASPVAEGPREGRRREQRAGTHHPIPSGSGSSSLATRAEPQQGPGGRSHPRQLEGSGGEPGVAARPGRCRCPAVPGEVP